MEIVKNDAGLFQTEIDGKVYEFEKWGADEATDAILDIAAICGKPLGMGAAAIFGPDEDGKKGLDKKLDPNVIGTVMEALAANVGAHKATIKALIKKLSSDRVLCDGKKIIFTSHYQDQLPHMFNVVRAALEVQYGNFFGVLLGVSGIRATVSGLTNRAPQK